MYKKNNNNAIYKLWQDQLKYNLVLNLQVT